VPGQKSLQESGWVAALLKDPELVTDILTAVIAAVDVPVTL
jgi:tRNA-dihydrouridine synthase